MNLPGRTRRWLGLVALMPVGLAALTTALAPATADTVGPLGVMFGYGLAGAIFLTKARRFDGRERLAWMLVGLGLTMGALGILVVGVVSAVTGSAPAFGPTDVFFLLAYALVLTGFGTLPHVDGDWLRRSRIILDGLVGAVSIGVVLWLAFVGDVIRGFEGAPPWERVVGSTYPLLDLAQMTLAMIVVIRRSSLRFDPRMVLFGMGMTVQAIADLDYLLKGVGRSFEEASPNYLVFLTATACYLVAGLLLHRRPRPREYAESRIQWWPMVAPYGAALVMVGLLVIRVARGDLSGETRDLLIATLVVAGLVIARQAVAIRENALLVERQRSALVSSISHELRTPLTAMVGFVSIMADQGDSLPAKERAELTGIVHQQATYMAGIVSDLVMLARKGSQLELHESIVSFSEVMASTLSSVEQGRQPEVTVELAPGLMARVDPNRTQQVLSNLISNALRYGGARTLVVIRRDGADLVVEVHDDGPGVPHRFQLVIWERFERGAHRYDAAIPGSGIGLAVVDAVVRAHGGTATYRPSERLGGACFVVTFSHRAVVPSTERVVVKGLSERSASPA